MEINVLFKEIAYPSIKANLSANYSTYPIYVQRLALAAAFK